MTNTTVHFDFRDVKDFLMKAEEVIDRNWVMEEINKETKIQGMLTEFYILWTAFNRPEKDDLFIRAGKDRWIHYDMHEVRCLLDTSQPFIVNSLGFQNYLAQPKEV